LADFMETAPKIFTRAASTNISLHFDICFLNFFFALRWTPSLPPPRKESSFFLLQPPLLRIEKEFPAPRFGLWA